MSEETEVNPGLKITENEVMGSLKDIYAYVHTHVCMHT